MARIVTENGRTFLRDDWGIEDVHAQVDCMDKPAITDEQALQVLELCVEGFDAYIGINWEVIEQAIEQIMGW